MAHLRGTLGDRIEYFESTHQLTGAVYLDVQPAVAHLPQHLGQPFGARTRPR